MRSHAVACLEQDVVHLVLRGHANDLFQERAVGIAFESGCRVFAASRVYIHLLVGLQIVAHNAVAEHLVREHHVRNTANEYSTNAYNAKPLAHSRIFRPKEYEDGQEAHQPARAGKAQVHGIGGDGQDKDVVDLFRACFKPPHLEEVQDNGDANAHNHRHGVLILKDAGVSHESAVVMPRTEHRQAEKDGDIRQHEVLAQREQGLLQGFLCLNLRLHETEQQGEEEELDARLHIGDEVGHRASVEEALKRNPVLCLRPQGRRLAAILEHDVEHIACQGQLPQLRHGHAAHIYRLGVEEQEKWHKQQAICRKFQRHCFGSLTYIYLFTKNHCCAKSSMWKFRHEAM